jgi:hypothetical protein
MEDLANVRYGPESLLTAANEPAPYWNIRVCVLDAGGGGGGGRKWAVFHDLKIDSRSAVGVELVIT